MPGTLLSLVNSVERHFAHYSTFSSVLGPSPPIAMKPFWVLLVLALTVIGCGKTPRVPGAAPATPDAVPPEFAARTLEAASFALELKARLAEEAFIVPAWDRLNAAEKPLEVLAEIPFETFQIGVPQAARAGDYGIVLQDFREGGEVLSPARIRELLEGFAREGYAIRHTDWHQEAFEEPQPGAYRSLIGFRIHAELPGRQERVRLLGQVAVDWQPGETWRAGRIALRRLEVARRAGSRAFEVKFSINGPASGGAGRSAIGALVAADLDGDGLPEILVGDANTLYRNRGDWKFEPEPLLPLLPEGQSVGLLLAGDFDGDAITDLLAVSGGKLRFFHGEPGGHFPGAGEVVPLPVPLVAPTCLTAGDVNGDGSLDVFLGQWRQPMGDQMPAPFWDANDGHGNVLLLNDGHAHFTDATAAAGLAAKSHRRTYSASFVDLDGDHALDLMVVSDFYGTDLFHNDGHGHFTDVTSRLDEPHTFGMSHAIADFDGDGQLDLFVAGMGSTTARRLQRMGANPKDFPEHNRMREVMGYGNRMYLATGGGFRQPAFKDEVARTGWSWGCATLDFDNDGDRDIYVANGHISGTTTRDYCTHFWTKDIYLANQMAGRDFTKSVIKNLPGIDDMSWDGFQANRLLLNRDGKGFDELGYLLDVGFTADCRQVVAADFDRDGRCDLLISRIGGTNGMLHHPALRNSPPALFGLRNVWEPARANHWIGVDLQGTNIFGARLNVETDDRTFTACHVSGDSPATQHPATLHLGLGPREKVRRLTVTWPGGRTTVIENPTVDHYHSVR